MWPAVRDGFVSFFTNKTYFMSIWDKWVAKVRGAVMMFGAAIAIPGTGFAERIEAVVGAKWRPAVGLALMGLALMFRAGDRTPENIKNLSRDMKPPDAM